MTEASRNRTPGDFRRSPRQDRDSAHARAVPEERDGALPADAETPEFSRGERLDDPQPSARRRPELDTQESLSTDADVRSDKRDI
jgi:hypothetical protein